MVSKIKEKSIADNAITVTKFTLDPFTRAGYRVYKFTAGTGPT